MEAATNDALNSEKTSPRGVFDSHDPSVRIRTKRMLMYLIIFAVVMIFAGLTSAYLVINSGKYWVHITCPPSLWYSTGVIALSSLALWLAHRELKNNRPRTANILLPLSFILGLLFCYFQYQGWRDLSEKGMGFQIREENGVKISRWNRISEIHATYGKDYYVYRDGQVLAFENGEFYMPDDQLRSRPLTPEVNKTSNLSSSFIAVLITIHLIHLAFGMIYLLVLQFRLLTGRLSASNSISLTTGGMYWHFLAILWIYLFVFLFFIH